MLLFPEWKRAEGARDPNCAATMSPRGAACQFFPGIRPSPADRRTGASSAGSAAGSCQRSSTSKVSIPTRAAAGSRTQSFAVVTRTRAGTLRVAAQPHNFSRAEPVMIGKRTRHDNFGPDPPQAGEKLGWAADPGECRHANAAEPGCVYRLKAGPQDRPSAVRTASGGSPSPIRTIASARARPVLTGSRNGPAGMTRPLPNPYSASMTTQRQVLGDPRVLKPVIEHDRSRRRLPPLRGIRRHGRARPSTARVAPAATPRRRPRRRRAASDRRAPGRRAARHSRASRRAPRRRVRQ